MTEQATLLDILTKKAMQDGQLTLMRPVIRKEILHYDILFCLEKAGVLGDWVFQGGTSLRLCYGSQRYSEDLDFVAGRDFDPSGLTRLKSLIESHLGKRYGLGVIVKEPRSLKESRSTGDGVQVHRWQVAVETDPEQRNLPKQRIRIEVANIPAYTSEVRKLKLNYDFLPEGYGDLLLLVETLDEIMADKLVSLAASRKNVRHRDIWDLSWLMQKGAVLRPDLIARKIADYGIPQYPAMAESIITKLPSIIAGKPFREELKRFLPFDTYQRSVADSRFEQYLVDALVGLYSELQSVTRGIGHGST